MRITGLLILLFLVLIFFAAPAASYAQGANADPVVARSSDSVPFEGSLRGLVRGDGVQLERDGVCYTMRTYKVAREDKDSDVTHPVRVTRCMPAWKLEFKSAVAPVRTEDEAAKQK
jgi:hypothetical protein